MFVRLPQITFSCCLLSILLTVMGPLALAAEAGSCHDLFHHDLHQSIGQNAEQAKAAHPYRKFKSPLTTPPRVSITSFAGLNSFHESRSVRFEKRGDHFYRSGKLLHLIRHKKEDGSYLDDLQKLPLSKMVETGYLTGEQAKMFQGLGSSLDTRQITFYEVSREATLEQLEQYPSELLAARYEEFKGRHYARTASLWTVAGQVFERDGLRPLPLPWEKEPARKSQQLDRNKIKYVWEWGRASQDIAEEINSISSASAGDIYNQLLATGGKVEDAYVMMHSFDKVNTRLYELDNPGTRYPADWKDNDDCLFLIPLSQILRKHPPARFSGRVQDIVDASEGLIDEAHAMNLLLENQLSRWQEYDLTSPFPQKNPIVITDYSHLTALKMNLRLNTIPFGTNERFKKVFNLLDGKVDGVYSANYQNKYEHAPNVEETHPYFDGLGVIDISNLDPEIAKRDPHAVAKLLAAVYEIVVYDVTRFVELSEGLPQQKAQVKALQLIAEKNPRFAISSQSPEIRKQCDDLSPMIKARAPAVRTDSDHHARGAAPWLWNDSYLAIYSLPAVQRMYHGNEAYFHANRYDLYSDFWRHQYFSSLNTLL